jgi:hypothetical protein
MVKFYKANDFLIAPLIDRPILAIINCDVSDIVNDNNPDASVVLSSVKLIKEAFEKCIDV